MNESNHLLIDTLKNTTINSCPRIYNFHSHTTFSDGSLSPIELIKQAFSIKLRHLAVTDHHNVDAYLIMKDWIDNNIKYNQNSLNLWTGIEITCLLKNSLVHVLGIGFDLNSPFISCYTKGQSVIGDQLRATNVVSSIHKANGIAILAHPARYKLHYKELIFEANNLGFDGIEVWYDYERSNLWAPTKYICDQISEYTKSLGLLSTCGTDTHGISLLRR